VTIEVALFLHLLGAFSLVSGTILAGAAFEGARRRQSPRDVALLLGLTRIGVALVGLGTLVVLPFGLWLVHLELWSWGAAWIDTALALLVVMAALGTIGGQKPKQARRLAKRLAADGVQDDDRLRALLDDPGARAANYLSALLLLAIIALMVFKPGAY
jgi:uncharacterized membrane protein